MAAVSLDSPAAVVWLSGAVTTGALERLAAADGNGTTGMVVEETTGALDNDAAEVVPDIESEFDTKMLGACS